MTVRVKIKGIAITMSDKLEQNLIKLASKYHPEGELELYPARGTTDLQKVIYVPDGTLTPILISTEGDEIVDITGLVEEGVKPHPRCVTFINVFNEAKANTDAKKKVSAKQPTASKVSETSEVLSAAPAQPKGIRVENTHLLPTDGNLGKDLVELAKRYYPDGVLEIGSKSSYDAIRFTGYYPDNKEFAPIEIASRCEVIGEVTTSYRHQDNPKARAFIDAFKKAQARVAEKQLAEKQAPVKKGIEVLNHVDYLQPKDIDTIRKVASMYYPSGCIDIRDLGNRGHLVNVFDTGNPQYGTIKFYSHYSTLGALDVGLPNETDPKIIEHKKAFIDAYNKFKLDAYNESKQKVEPDTVLSVAPAPVQQAQPTPKNYRRIDGTKRKLYFVEGQFYPPYDPVMVAIGDSPKNSEVYTEDGQKLYLGVNRYKLLQQSHRAGLRVTSINPKNGGSQKALQYFKIELV